MSQSATQPLTPEKVEEILAKISKAVPELHDEAMQSALRYFKDMPAQNTDIGSFYDSIPPAIYEEMMTIMNFKELDKISFAAWKMNLPADAQILDVGAGTGNIGKRLRACGLTNPIDAVDACQKYL